MKSNRTTFLNDFSKKDRLNRMSKKDMMPSLMPAQPLAVRNKKQAPKQSVLSRLFSAAKNETTKRNLKIAAVAISALIIAWNSTYKIPLGHMGNLVRAGQLVYDEPLVADSHYHFKLPFVDQVTTIPVTLQTLYILHIQAATKENRDVVMAMAVHYTIPKAAANKLLTCVDEKGESLVPKTIDVIVRNNTARFMAGQALPHTYLTKKESESYADDYRKKGELSKKISEDIERVLGVNVQSSSLVDFKPTNNVTQISYNLRKEWLDESQKEYASAVKEYASAVKEYVSALQEYEASVARAAALAGKTPEADVSTKAGPEIENTSKTDKQKPEQGAVQRSVKPMGAKINNLTPVN